jgi:hypothetical protein
MIFQQRAAYEALAATLAEHSLTLMIGQPRALQVLPAAYLVSAQIEVTPNRYVARLRPTLTLAVAWQDETEAEWQIMDLVDRVAPSLLGSISSVCRATIETVTYTWREIGGVTYRVADLGLVLSQM